MIKQNKIFFLLISTLFFISLISAVPGFPHQFYGSVIVNSQPAPDNNIITANVGGESYVTTTKDGKYGYSPNIFYTEDPEGKNAEEEIIFYLGGKEVGAFNFVNNGLENFNIDTTTTCGDNYCLGDETCSSCSGDCGVCTDPPIITITSPINKVYDALEVNLDVSTDQSIVVWMYSLNSEDMITFTPNIVITAQEGENKITVVGINQAFQSGSNEISFTVELSQVDPPANNPGGGSSSSSSSSSSTSSSNTNSNEDTNTDLTTISKNEGNEKKENIESEKTSGITGSVIGFVKSGKGIGSIIFVVLVIAGGIFINMKKGSEESELKK